MDASLVARLEKLTSVGRLQRYRTAAASDLETAVLYLWNIELTGALLPAIAILEVSLRNAVHASLTRKEGTEFWFQSVLQSQKWLNIKRQIIDDLQAEYGATLPAGKVIAELTFGTWPHIFANYYRHLWWNPPEPPKAASFDATRLSSSIALLQ